MSILKPLSSESVPIKRHTKLDVIKFGHFSMLAGPSRQSGWIREGKTYSQNTLWSK